MTDKSTTLYFKDDRSDKVYTATITASGDGFLVNFAYGRRGATQTTGSKTSSPVDLAAAEKIFDKLIREKEAKGYSPGEDGVKYQHTAKADRVAAYLPQLLNTVEESEVPRLLADSKWMMQPKFDGRRIMVVKDNGNIYGINKLGLTVDLPLPVVEAANALVFDFVVDGEMIGDRHHAFDLISLDGTDLRKTSCTDRRRLLAGLLLGEQGSIVQTPTWSDPESKAAALAQLRADNAEGAVFKRVDSLYKPGRPSKGGTQLKFKFVETCSAVVACHNTKRSIAVRLVNDGGCWESYGNVAIPPNKDIPDVGAVVEIKYLYAYPGSLYQPIYLGVRDDVTEAECLVSQIKFKKEVL